MLQFGQTSCHDGRFFNNFFLLHFIVLVLRIIWLNLCTIFLIKFFNVLTDFRFKSLLFWLSLWIKFELAIWISLWEPSEPIQATCKVLGWVKFLCFFFCPFFNLIRFGNSPFFIYSEYYFSHIFLYSWISRFIFQNMPFLKFILLLLLRRLFYFEIMFDFFHIIFFFFIFFNLNNYFLSLLFWNSIKVSSFVRSRI